MYRVLILLLFPLLSSAQFSLFGIYHSEGRWISPVEYTAPDKLLHMGAGYALGATTTAIAYRILKDKRNAAFAGAFTTFLVAMTKEAIDDQIRPGSFDEVDMWATVWGGVAGSLTVNYTFNYGSRYGRLPEQKKRDYRKSGIYLIEY